MNDTTLIISGATVVCEHTVLPDHDVFVRNGRIAAIRPSSGTFTQGRSEGSEVLESAEMHLLADAEISDSSTAESAMGSFDEAFLGSMPTIVDARGAYVIPGLIDVHSDYIETVASPRPSAIMDLPTSLLRAERELVAHGVTTIFHSLSVYQTSIFDHKPIRNFENVTKLIEGVEDLRRGEEFDHLIRHRLHLRIEIDSVDRYEAVKAYVNEGRVDMVSFMDHTPGQGQYADLSMFGSTLKGYRDVSDEHIADIIAAQQASDKLTLAQMTEIARLARKHGIAVASHDDDSSEKLDCMESCNAVISEFPITMDVAHDARKRGMHTLAGAPNVVMGKSHSGNLSAREAVKEGAIDMLCSDYYPAALLQAVFLLHHVCGVELNEAVSFATANPAKAAGLFNEVGSIAVGKRADILVVRELPVVGASDVLTNPVVTQAYVAGRLVYGSRYPMFADESTDSPLAIDQLAQEQYVLDDERMQADAERVQVIR